jgi:hypothetical protein
MPGIDHKGLMGGNVEKWKYCSERSDKTGYAVDRNNAENLKSRLR